MQTKLGVITSVMFGVTLLGSSFTPIALGEGIYRYTDSHGVINFTDRPINRLDSKKNFSIPTTEIITIYKFVDAHGVIHLTDQPKDASYKIVYQGSGTLQPIAGGTYSAFTAIRSKLQYRELIESAAAENNLEVALLHAVIQTESAYNPRAVSPKGAVGLMQLMPGTAQRYGVTDRTDAGDNVRGGARYLRDLLDMFNGDKRLAVAGYNAGENAVKRYGGIPPYRETQNYVVRVMEIYERHLANSG